MLQLVLLSDFLFPPRSDMFEFAFSISKFTSRGPERVGGGSPANEDTPLHPVKTYLLFRQIAGAKLRTLSIDLFSRNYNFSDDELF